MRGLRPALAVLAVAALVMLFVWRLASVAPESSARGPSPQGVQEPSGSPAPTRGAPPGASLASAPRPVDEPRLAALRRPDDGAGRPAGSEATPTSSSAAHVIPTGAPAFVSLPLASEELGPDGLPVAGVRCTWDGAGFNCGQCRTDGDCPANQGCVVNGQTRRFECMASECEEDGHCFPGFLCRAVTNGATGGTIIRRCVREGLRGPGEPCDILPVSPAGSCREGLVCVGQVCATRCRPGDPSSCPAGHTCLEELDGAGCMPDCRWLGCAEGLKCQQVRGEDYRCLASARGDCRETPCPEGEHCNVRGSRGRAVFWCARLCNPLQPASCPEGQLCGMGSATASTCYRRCDPTVPDSCGEGWACATISEDMTLWGCRPELAP